MKKNKAMRLASVLLVLTLLTTCMTAGTFAKYTTEAAGTATARVAKFGVEVSVTPRNVFGKNYKDKNNNNVVTTDDDNTNITVAASEIAVAPGTTGSMSFSITGTPETDVKLAISLGEAGSTLKEVMLKGETNRKYKDVTKDKESKEIFAQEKDYYPVKWTLKDKDTVVKYTPSDSVEKSLENVKLSEIEDYFKVIRDKDYNVNTDLSKITGERGTGNYTLSWSWDFEDNQNETNDKADTLLGDLVVNANLAAKWNSQNSTFEALKENDDYCLTEAFKLTIKVEQVD